MNSIRDAIVRDICETDPSSPDAQYTVCISLQSLELILDRHLSCDDRVVAGFLQKGSLIFGANVEGELTCDCFEITFRGARHIVPVHLTASREKLEGALCLPAPVAPPDTVPTEALQELEKRLRIRSTDFERRSNMEEDEASRQWQLGRSEALDDVADELALMISRAAGGAP